MGRNAPCQDLQAKIESPKHVSGGWRVNWNEIRVDVPYNECSAQYRGRSMIYQASARQRVSVVCMPGEAKSDHHLSREHPEREPA